MNTNNKKNTNNTNTNNNKKRKVMKKKVFDISKIKPLTNEEKIAVYNGGSVRNWAKYMRSAKIELPKIYMFCSSLPIRSEDGKRVIVEGKYELGCYWKGKPMTLARFIAQSGYKLPTKGAKDRCIELLAEYKSALNQTGKYAPKAKKDDK